MVGHRKERAAVPASQQRKGKKKAPAPHGPLWSWAVLSGKLYGGMSNIFCGKRDSTTKESVKQEELKAMRKIMNRNPGYQPVSKTGTKIKVPEDVEGVGKKVGSVAEEKYRSGKFGWLVARHRALVEGGHVHDTVCRHNPEMARRAADYVDGRVGGGGASLKCDIAYDEATHIALRSGYYIIAGEIVYMHTDGSLCRMLQGEQECPCGYTHTR